MPEWTLVEEWEGGKTYVDTSEIKREDHRCTAWVLYDMVRAGELRNSDKKVQRLFNLEEYDFNMRQFRIHRIRFGYVDGSDGEPFTTVPEWTPASGGNETILNFLLRGA